MVAAEKEGKGLGEALVHQRLLGSRPRPAGSMRTWLCPRFTTSLCQHVMMSCATASQSVASVICLCVPVPAGIMLGRMGDSGTPLVSFCQCLNESVMKIVAVAVW